ncbi:MAG: phosphatase PAP2 family protein [Gammaproteobacteria bacterium]|nr:phosphatase PAP2 family protein [Gammaproteobacteria bacterium]
MQKISLPNFHKFLIYSFLTIGLAVLSYYFLDRPVAQWTYNNTKFHDWHLIWQYATYLQPMYAYLAPWYVFYFVIQIGKGRNIQSIQSWQKILLVMIISMWFTLAVNDQLRVLFGRYWPDTWFHGNLSYIQHKFYGFTWFKMNHEFKSFPSGHTSLIFGFMMALLWQVDNFKVKLFAIANCILVGIGLILMCYHFVSDVIIGALVGTICAYTVLYGLKISNGSRSQSKSKYSKS